jgi:DNA-directed RNA polymerase specialized sigma24 family protein
MPDDQQLLEHFAENRSEAAFGELVNRYVNLVYSTALRRTNFDTHLAQDVAQLVFTDLARKAPSLSRNVVLAGWLHRATLYAAGQLMRSDRLNKDLTLKPEQLDGYLRARGRDAASLLAAYRTTSDPALLSEAMRNFPDNPEVAYEAATRKDVSPDEQRHWLDALKKSAPDNALANYLSALDYFNAGQPDQAVKEFMAASGKRFEDYSSQRYQNDAEAYLAASYSVADAKFAAGTGLLLPQLQMTKDAGLDMIELAKSYQQTGDSASAQAAMQMAIDLGQRYGTSSPGEPVLSQLAGLSIEIRTLNAMDPNAAYGSITVQDQLNQIKQQSDNLKQQSQQVGALLPSMSEQDWAIYNDRWLTFGEQNAYQWVINRYGRNSATANP